MPSFQDMPIKKLLIKPKNLQDKTLDDIFFNLNAFIRSNKGYSATNIWDYRDYEKSINQSKNLIDIIFTILIAVVMILCFFSLISSMTANIIE